MLRFFLFMAAVMAAGTGTAGDVSPCADTVPIQIMTPWSSGNEIQRSVAEISSSLPYFRAFVTAVTEHVNSRLARDKLCINGAEGMDSMGSATSGNRSLLQFVHWRSFTYREYLVPVMTSIGGLPFPSCRISSPWIDLVIYREPIPYVTQLSQIRGIVRWNERQFLADQAVLDGVRNVPPGKAMPLSPDDFGHFRVEYEDTELSHPRKPATKPIEERVPPDILWLFRRSMHTRDANFVSSAMLMVGAESYTKLVIALIDRCFASGRESFHYNSILDAADLIPLDQYKIDMPPIR
jgi:hypothetical protein